MAVEHCLGSAGNDGETHPIATRPELLANIRLLRAELFEQLPTPLPRSQDLPDSFFGTPAAGDVVIAVSHGWRNQSHPDPKGEKQASLNDMISCRIRKARGNRVFLFLDFLSLTQRPFRVGQKERTQDEEMQFKIALACMHNVYFYADYIIHLPFEDYSIEGEEEDYVVEAKDLETAVFGQVGPWVQVIGLSIETGSDHSLAGTHGQPYPFDRVLTVNDNVVSSVGQLRHELTKQCAVTLRRYPFGRINRIHPDDRGWIFCERFITMVKCAMLDHSVAKKVVITPSHDLLMYIEEHTDTLRQAAKNQNEVDTSLRHAFNDFLKELTQKQFSSVSFDKQHATTAVSPDAVCVQKIMSGFVDHLNADWNKEAAKQRARFKKLKSVVNYVKFLRRTSGISMPANFKLQSNQDFELGSRIKVIAEDHYLEGKFGTVQTWYENLRMCLVKMDSGFFEACFATELRAVKELPEAAAQATDIANEDIACSSSKTRELKFQLEEQACGA
jgi:hypothetical protein